MKGSSDLDLSDLIIELNHLKEKKKQVAKNFNEEIKALELEIEKLAGVVKEKG